MKKIIFLLAVTLSVVEASFSQGESNQFIRKGLLRAMATISPGEMLKENASTIYLHGNLEYYIDDNISLRGDAFYFLKGMDFLKFNHSIFSGASYHFKTKNNFDPYVSIEPGIAISQANAYWLNVIPPETDGNVTANPLVSSVVGFNFYFQSVFHLFMEARYIYGKHLSNAYTPLSLSELRFSFGLGFNLNLIKKKK